jgi:hypothetical protein
VEQGCGKNKTEEKRKKERQDESTRLQHGLRQRPTHTSATTTNVTLQRVSPNLDKKGNQETLAILRKDMPELIQPGQGAIEIGIEELSNAVLMKAYDPA